jgi:hypothetical protein
METRTEQNSNSNSNNSNNSNNNNKEDVNNKLTAGRKAVWSWTVSSSTGHDATKRYNKEVNRS